MAPPTLPEKIGGRHRDRLAVVYVRQSTLQQVGRHPRVDPAPVRAGRTRPPARLAPRAGRGHRRRPRPLRRLGRRTGRGSSGWSPRSGSATSASCSASRCRAWPARAATGTSCSRSAPCSTRSSPTATACYDPAAYNDRLLLGLKGTMSEAELHILQGPHATRGAGPRPGAASCSSTCRAATCGRPSGEVALDPDEQVRATIRLVFDLFERRRTINGVLRLPGRPRHPAARIGCAAGRARASSLGAARTGTRSARC